MNEGDAMVYGRPYPTSDSAGKCHWYRESFKLLGLYQRLRILVGYHKLSLHGSSMKIKYFYS